MPPLWLIKAGAVLALLVGIWWHGHYLGAAGVQGRWDAENHRRVTAALKATAEAREEEQRRVAAHQEIAHVAELSRTRADADRRAADAAGQRLQQRVAATAARCDAASNPAVASPGPAASAPGDLLAEVQRRIDDAAGELADAADRARIAGLSCERAYDALTRQPAQ